MKITAVHSQILALSFAVIALTSACNFEYEKSTQNDVGGNLRQLETIGFDQVNDAIFKPKCLGCHANRAPDLSSYEAVIASLAAVEEAVLVKQTMPRRGPLSADLQSILRSWIDAGAPRVGTAEPVPSASTTPPVTGIPRPFTYANLKSAVLEQKCLGCHSSGKSGPTPLDTYASLMTVKEWIIPLTIGVSGKEIVPVEERMPPPRAPQLTEEEKAFFLIWAADGNRDENGNLPPGGISEPSSSTPPSNAPTPSSAGIEVLPSGDLS